MGPAFIRGKPARLAGMVRLAVLDRLIPCFLLKTVVLFIYEKTGRLACRILGILSRKAQYKIVTSLPGSGAAAELLMHGEL